MVIGIGVDIVEVERFRDISLRFVERVYTKAEQEYLSGKGAESYAGLFAAKEAVVKALGTGFAGFFPRDVEVRYKPSGQPYIRLHGRARDICKKRAATPLHRGVAARPYLHISISHTKSDAIAFAVLGFVTASPTLTYQTPR